MVRAPNPHGEDPPEAPWPGGASEFVSLFRDAALAAEAQIARELRARGHADAPPALLAVVERLRPEGSRVTELARQLSLTKATVVRNVDELERLEYVRRAPDPGDGRAKLVQATERGRAAAADVRAAVAELRQRWAAALGPGELELLERLLGRLREAPQPSSWNSPSR